MATSAPPLANSRGSASPRRELLSVVIPLSDLSSIQPWKQVLSRYHVVIVSQHSNLNADLPDCELHSLDDARKALKAPAGGEQDGKLLALSYGILVSKRKYVVLLDLDHCSPVDDPLEQHLVNLTTPSTPYFFNTLYDPFRQGADFVRGYPFSMRTGVPTAVSHGLWCEDAANVVDAVLTIPRNVFFPMNSINVAFDRDLVGAAIGSCCSSVLLTGMLVKAICDHLGYGVKSGLPYVKLSSSSSQASKQEIEEEVVEFFSSLSLPKSASSAEDCVLEVAKQMKAKVEKLSSVASSMEAWIQAWKHT